MCGRMTMTHPNDAMAQLFEAAPSNDLPEGPDYNVCPTQTLAVVTTGAEQGRRLRPMRWGFLPHWYKSPTDGPLLINARAETVAEKPAFRAACRERRCLIPATGFYEWVKGPDGARLPWYFTTPDDAPLVFGGVWRDWTAPDGSLSHTTCAVVTVAAGPWMAEIHHREPLTLAREDWPLWLGEAGHGAATLMKPAPEGRFRRWRVDPAVNSNRASGADLITPIAA